MNCRHVFGLSFSFCRFDSSFTVSILHTPQYQWIFILYGSNYSEERNGQLAMECINYMNFRIEVQCRVLWIVRFDVFRPFRSANPHPLSFWMFFDPPPRLKGVSFSWCSKESLLAQLGLLSKGQASIIFVAGKTHGNSFTLPNLSKTTMSACTSDVVRILHSLVSRHGRHLKKHITELVEWARPDRLNDTGGTQFYPSGPHSSII